MKPGLRASIVAVSFAVTACGDSSGPGVDQSGTVAFDYSGAGGGAFSATGVVPNSIASLGSRDWSAGFSDPANSRLQLSSAKARGSGRYDYVVIYIPLLTTGTVAIDPPECDMFFTENCAWFFFESNYSHIDGHWDHNCFLEAGALTITEISTTRVTGTFTGSGTCLAGSNGASSDFTVTNGTFDLALVNPPS